MTDFVYGLLSGAYLIGAAFFLHFWSRTREPLLLMFAAAFALLSLTQALLGLLELEREEQSWVYLIRLCSFLLIIGGIVSVNLKKR